LALQIIAVAVTTFCQSDFQKGKIALQADAFTIGFPNADMPRPHCAKQSTNSKIRHAEHRIMRGKSNLHRFS